jgi:hypothetical protein
MEPAVEQLDLEALVKGGTIKPKRASNGSSQALAQTPLTQRANTAAPPPVGTVFDDDAIVDSSSWSESDEEVADVEDVDKDSSEEKKPDTSGALTLLEDPLGIHGNLNLYDPRYDLASVKFDAAALLSGVHYATSYDRLRTALETLKPQQMQEGKQQQKGLMLGMTEVCCCCVCVCYFFLNPRKRETILIVLLRRATPSLRFATECSRLGLAGVSGHRTWARASRRRNGKLLPSQNKFLSVASRFAIGREWCGSSLGIARC